MIYFQCSVGSPSLSGKGIGKVFRRPVYFLPGHFPVQPKNVSFLFQCPDRVFLLSGKENRQIFRSPFPSERSMATPRRMSRIISNSRIIPRDPFSGNNPGQPAERRFSINGWKIPARFQHRQHNIIKRNHMISI